MMKSAIKVPRIRHSYTGEWRICSWSKPDI
jgi:hypothetical protein